MLFVLFHYTIQQHNIIAMDKQTSSSFQEYKWGTNDSVAMDHRGIIIYHHISSYIIIYHHISAYIIIYYHISSYIIVYHHILSYIIIYHHI
jgi:hypothetical protein